MNIETKMAKIFHFLSVNRIWAVLLIEFFERFSFFGVRCILLLYMTQHFSFHDSDSFCMYSIFMALTYATSLMGAFISDYSLGYKRSIILGSVLMSIGYGCLCLPFLSAFYVGLSFIIVGSGLFKPNVTSLLGYLCLTLDNQRETIFTLFYTIINISAALSALICGYIGQVYGWQWSFVLSFAAMSTGMLIFVRTEKNIPSSSQENRKEDHATRIRKREVWCIILMFLSVLPTYYTLLTRYFLNYIMPFLGILTLIFSAVIFYQSSREERKNLLAIFIVMSISICFFALDEQGASSIALFSARNVDRTFLGMNIAVGQLQAITPLLIIVLGPLLACIWHSLRNRKGNSLSPLKIAAGLMFLGIGFGCLVTGTFFTGNKGQVSLFWVVLAYACHVIGELLVSPVGLSTVTKLAPRRVNSIVVSFWFIVLSFGNYLSGFVANFASLSYSNRDAIPAEISLSIYHQAFIKMGILSFIMSVFVFMLIPFIKSCFIRKEFQP